MIYLQALCLIIFVAVCISVILTTMSHQTGHDHCFTEGALNVMDKSSVPTMLAVIIVSTIILIITIILNVKIIVRLTMSRREASAMISQQVLSEREQRDHQITLLISVTSFVYIFLTLPQVNCQMVPSQRKKSS